jgi:hypothetical protein
MLLTPIWEGEKGVAVMISLGLLRSFHQRDRRKVDLRNSFEIERLEHRVLLSSYSIDPLARFATNSTGMNPSGGLAIDAEGNPFGVAQNGGAYGFGAAFELPHGNRTLVTLASFDGADGEYPSGNVAVDAAGNVYGMTEFGGDGVSGEGGPMEERFSR